MSTTSPSSAFGRCVVCGKESLKGCSKCKAAGLDWMYFCSVDHQRLVSTLPFHLVLWQELIPFSSHSFAMNQSFGLKIWNVHKRVCGENPFRFPLLDKDEAEEMLSLKREACSSAKSEGKPWSDVILKALSPSSSPGGTEIFQELDDIYQRFVQALQQPSVSNPIFHDDSIRKVRTTLFSAKLQQAQISDQLYSVEGSRQLLLEDPFGLLARILSVYIDDSTCPGILEREWRSDFQHRLFILIARLQIEVKSEDNKTERRELSPEQLMEFKPYMEACDLIPSPDSSGTNLEIFNDIMFEVFGFAGYPLSFVFCRERMSVE
ncbi:hypothetical protein JCM5350_008320 [Sporobolomyces pararoseus]